MNVRVFYDVLTSLLPSILHVCSKRSRDMLLSFLSHCYSESIDDVMVALAPMLSKIVECERVHFAVLLKEDVIKSLRSHIKDVCALFAL